MLLDSGREKGVVFGHLSYTACLMPAAEMPVKVVSQSPY